MAGSYRASQIDKEYKRKKFYEGKKKVKNKDDERLEEMVENFINDMKKEGMKNES